ncbi:6-phosphogluconolactonase [Acetobacter sp. TBRC 12305]|uniref:6-phosphogluconolactonase n=1 Tax=Acetobacter garciniae TaxID=2817435 RepID=A0A939HIS2_9PROT|nr:6-phosphogluconolactonase [Acetobacter garciniae]MBO1325198.1 6-phosphogluconolactonase [Acetobacter garciniae]MBX0344831.1 6-phosphogluconolactonase [Acetobacter garciniae]
MRVFPTGKALIEALADHLLALALEPSDRPFRMALSGGSTPQRLYTLMASPPYAQRFPWQRMQFFVGDDRFVPHDHADSNAGMFTRLLFAHVPVPGDNIFLMPDSGAAEDAARTYEATLRRLYGGADLLPGKPLFDVNLLGLGTDGHTASLFPGQAVLDERRAWVGTCTPATAPHTRLTLTYPCLHASRHVIFLAEGAAKAPVLARVRAGDTACPAAAITAMGDVTWFVDQLAASG